MLTDRFGSNQIRAPHAYAIRLATEFGSFAIQRYYTVFFHGARDLISSRSRALR
jgi:hypothetical protein